MDPVEIAKELIQIPTPSPRSNAEIVDWLQKWFRAADFETERVTYADAAGVSKQNIIARTGPHVEGGLTFFAHTDTVPAGNWECGEAFKPWVEAGKLFGRGACDMKGPLAAVLAAAGTVHKRDLARPLYIVCTADEENGYLGAQETVRHSQLFQKLKTGVGVVVEPTELEVVYAHKAAVGLQAVARGVAAHSATGKGVNANLKLIPFLMEMKQLHDELQTDPRHRNDEFDPPTPGWNITISDGETPLNVTPPRAVCNVYFRPMPGTDTDGIISRVKEAADRYGLELVVWGCKKPLYTDPNSEFVRSVLDCVNRDRARTVPYGTDGLAFGEHMPLVVLGPGSVDQAHTSLEWISISQLEQAVEIYRRLIARFCCN